MNTQFLQRGTAVLALGAALLAGCSSNTPPSPAMQAATDAQSGTITFTGGAVALGVGFQWGSGTLSYQGVDYPFRMTGVSIVDVGVTRVSGSGRVTGLRNVADFNGNYAAATAGATVAGGGSVSVLRNQNGVTIDNVSTAQGARLTFAPSGVNFSLTQ
jgi:hypothetical protein